MIKPNMRTTTHILTSLELLCEIICTGCGHVLWEGVSGDLGTGQGQGVDQGVVQKFILLLIGKQDSVLCYNYGKT